MMKRAVALMVVLGALTFTGCMSSDRAEYYRDNPAVVANRVSMGIFCYTTTNGIVNAMKRVFFQRSTTLTFNKGAGIIWTGTLNQPSLGDFTISAMLSKVAIDQDSCLRVDWKLVSKAGSLDEQASKAYVDGLNQDLFKCLKELDEEK